MRIMIVDDSIEKISELTKTIYSHSPQAIVQTSENISNAILMLSKEERFDLLIVDLLLPLRPNELPVKEGGKILVSDIYRKKDTLKLPRYIVGITQSEDENLAFSNIWGIIRFSYISTNWNSAFTQMLTHIRYNHEHRDIIEDSQSKPTIFVEGLTDKLYLEKTLKLFFPDFMDKVDIVSQKDAGANWVAIQVSIWAMKLEVDSEGNYIKAIGLFDSDEAGNMAKSDIKNRNLSGNMEKCYSVFQLKPNHNEKILMFYQNKCKIEMEIESLFQTDILQYADDQDWLDYRSPTFIEAPSDWKQHEENSIQYIMRKDLPEEDLIYAKKVKMAKKQAFSKYVDTIENAEEVFKNFKPLVSELLKKIGVLQQ